MPRARRCRADLAGVVAQTAPDYAADDDENDDDDDDDLALTSVTGPGDDALVLEVYRIADEHKKMRRYREAVAEYTRALQLGYKERWLCYNDRGLCHSKSDNHEAAFADYDRAVREEPNKTMPWNNRGYKHMHFKRWAEAKSDLDMALLIDPSNGPSTATSPSLPPPRSEMLPSFLVPYLFERS